MDKKAPTPTPILSMQTAVVSMRDKTGTENPIINGKDYLNTYVPMKRQVIDYVHGSGNAYTGHGGLEEGQSAVISNDQAVISFEQQQFLRSQLGREWLKRITSALDTLPDKGYDSRPTAIEKTENSEPVVLHGKEMVVSQRVAKFLEKRYPRLWNIGVPKRLQE